MDFLFYLLIALIVGILLTFVYSAISAISWVPMRRPDIDNVIKLANIKSGEKFCDLGCGDGRLVFAGGKKQAKAIGYELSLLLYLVAKIKSWFNTSPVEIKYRDFWLVNLADMDIVFFFLIPRIYPKMKMKLEKELKPGSRVITYMWPMAGWLATDIIKRKNGPAIYLYKIN